VHDLKQFLARSRVPFRWLDVERDAEARTLASAAVPGADIHRYCKEAAGAKPLVVEYGTQTPGGPDPEENP